MNISKIAWCIRALIYKIVIKKVGFPSYIGKPVYLANPRNISLGTRCRIYPGLRAEIVDANSFLTIGNNVSIGQNFHVVSYGDNLTIEDDVTISGNVLISNCAHMYKNIGQHILEQPLIKEKTSIGKGCFIGFGVVIQAGTILGKQCIVGANSVVKGYFPDNCVIAGVPARIIKKYDDNTKTWRKV